VEKDLPIHLIVFLPLLGAAINGLLGRRFSWTTVTAIACLASLIPFVLSVQAFMHMYSTGAEVIRQVPLFTWFATGTFSVDLGFTIDRLTSVFCLNVTGIGFLIHMYSSAYMKEDEGYFKFMAYLNLFLFSMLMLIMGENLLLMFVGWEGVGLCSYLLIGFWYTENANADAGKKAFITNRIGDFGFLMGIFFILYALNTQGLPMSLSFHDLQENAGRFSELATIIGLLLFVGAAGKSAQVPLYVWLPDAMAGPTPVSALIHAATMVTAGIYMVARMNFIYVQSPMAMTVVTSIGAITALFAATMGFAQNDIKKVLAYSTVSQLGYMFMGVGVGAYAAGLFHVITHAFFKACLFLGSGSVIHALNHEQDTRKMGGLLKKMPITGWTFALSTAAIAGFPLLSGFFSKDEILWKVFSNQNTLIPGWVFWLVAVAGAMCTAFYMVRVYALTFVGTYRGEPEARCRSWSRCPRRTRSRRSRPRPPRRREVQRHPRVALDDDPAPGDPGHRRGLRRVPGAAPLGARSPDELLRPLARAGLRVRDEAEVPGQYQPRARPDGGERGPRGPVRRRRLVHVRRQRQTSARADRHAFPPHLSRRLQQVLRGRDLRVPDRQPDQGLRPLLLALGGRRSHRRRARERAGGHREPDRPGGAPLHHR
jgi:proton-translocating NADH-quinone oxidoreductase chain L